MKYFGYKLVAITTFSGIPVVYELYQLIPTSGSC